MIVRPATRRAVLAGGAALAASTLASPLRAQSPQILMRAIPSSGETISAVGLGTWITFNVGDDPVLRDECAAVMAAFFDSGGRMIDSSPMYGSSQPVIGYGLAKLGDTPVFSADKVWTSSDGPAQIERSRQYWGVPRFDLLQVHNLLAWQEHLKTLYAMKEAGHIYREDSGVSFAASAMDAAKGADAVVIVTEWKAFRSPDFDGLRKVLRQPVIFDGRNLYEPAVVEGHGFEYHAIGRGTRAGAAAGASVTRAKVGA